MNKEDKKQYYEILKISKCPKYIKLLTPVLSQREPQAGLFPARPQDISVGNSKSHRKSYWISSKYSTFYNVVYGCNLPKICILNSSK